MQVTETEEADCHCTHEEQAGGAGDEADKVNCHFVHEEQTNESGLCTANQTIAC